MAKTRSRVIQISRKGMFVWIGLFLFVAAWMFVLGILVGRGLAPVNLDQGTTEQGLADLKAILQQQEESQGENKASVKGDEKPQLGFYEALKDPRREKRFKAPTAPKPKPKPAAKPAPKTRPKPAPKPSGVAKKAPAPKPAAKKSAPAKTKSGAGATAKAAKPDKGRFAIQVAAVKDIQRATGLVAQLRKKGYRAYQVRSEVAGKGVWYRVRVGAYESRGAAGPTLKKLQGDRFSGMIISTR